jgi:hypothetical protein
MLSGGETLFISTQLMAIACLGYRFLRMVLLAQLQERGTKRLRFVFDDIRTTVQWIICIRTSISFDL